MRSINQFSEIQPN